MTKQIEDRPVDFVDINVAPRSLCGCLTYFSLEKNYWEAIHDTLCARRPIRRREAVMATKAKL